MPVSSVNGLRRQCLSKNKRTQHGVKALDGGDADAADAVELRRLMNSPRDFTLRAPVYVHRFPTSIANATR